MKEFRPLKVWDIVLPKRQFLGLVGLQKKKKINANVSVLDTHKSNHGLLTLSAVSRCRESPLCAQIA